MPCIECSTVKMNFNSRYPRIICLWLKINTVNAWSSKKCVADWLLGIHLKSVQTLNGEKTSSHVHFVNNHSLTVQCHITAKTNEIQRKTSRTHFLAQERIRATKCSSALQAHLLTAQHVHSEIWRCYQLISYSTLENRNALSDNMWKFSVEFCRKHCMGFYCCY